MAKKQKKASKKKTASRSQKSIPQTVARVDRNTDIFKKMVPLRIEKHSFGEHRKASTTNIDVEGVEKNTADEAQVKALLSLRKRLLKSEQTAAVRNRDTDFYRFLRGVATPFSPGIWLVPFALVEVVDTEAQKWERERVELVEAAALVYPAHVAEMLKTPGDLYRAADYPSVAEFKAKYWAHYQFLDFGVPQVLKAIRADIFERETAKVKRQAAQAAEIVEQHLAGSLLKITEHLTALLQPKQTGKMPVLRDNALDKLFEFLDTAQARDVTNFTGFQHVTARLKTLAAGINVEKLRDDEQFRARIATEMEAAKDAVAALVHEQGRAIFLPEDDAEVA